MVFGVAAAFSRPAMTGIVREVVRAEALQEANALLGLSRNVFSVVGPALGGLIVVAGSPAVAIAIDAGTFFISAILLATLRLAALARVASASVLADLRDGWREFTSRTWVVAMVISFGLFQLTYFPAVFVLGPVVADEELGGAAVFGLMMAAGPWGRSSAGSLPCASRSGTRSSHRSSSSSRPGSRSSPSRDRRRAIVVIVASLFSGLGFAMGNVLWETTLQRNVPEHALSRISSFDWLGSVALNPIGYAMIGPIAAAVRDRPDAGRRRAAEPRDLLRDRARAVGAWGRDRAVAPRGRGGRVGRRERAPASRCRVVMTIGRISSVPRSAVDAAAAQIPAGPALPDEDATADDIATRWITSRTAPRTTQALVWRVVARVVEVRCAERSRRRRVEDHEVRVPPTTSAPLRGHPEPGRRRRGDQARPSARA